MNPEWLPDWWLNSDVYKWMAGPGNWILPLYLHLFSLVLEVSMFARLIKADPKHQGRTRVQRIAWLMFHLVVFIMTLGLLDGGITYYYWSGVWGLVVVLVSLMALLKVRRCDAETRQAREKYANLRGDQAYERKP